MNEIESGDFKWIEFEIMGGGSIANFCTWSNYVV